MGTGKVSKRSKHANFTFCTCAVNQCRGSGLFLKLHPVQ